MTLLSRPKPYTALNLNDFEFALPSSLDPSLPIRATVRESHRDTTALRVIYSPAFIRIGRPLIYAESSHELCMGLLDALLGWLSLHQFGFVHRDLSIANVLLTGSEPIGIPTNIPLCSPGVKDYLSANTTSGAPPADSPASRAQLPAEIAALLAQLPVMRRYAAAFLADGDIAIDWRTNLNWEDACTLTARQRPFSGSVLRTLQFVSLPLHRAMLRDLRHLQSPIDDIESFFWLLVWATLFNRHNPSSTRSKTEKEWQQWLDGADYKDKSTFTVELRRTQGSLSSITQELLPLLHKWWFLQEELRSQWDKTIQPDRKEGRKGTDEFYLPHFRHFALLGVRDFLNLVVDHLVMLKTYPKFTK
ncbi:hypothetical protein C8R43DRAFT_988621 [Mycena crocata]|nr:hypothetical protein C8R43DRAFT_988621 [Mycena crocata]